MNEINTLTLKHQRGIIFLGGRNVFRAQNTLTQEQNLGILKLKMSSEFETEIVLKDAETDQGGSDVMETLGRFLEGH